jgi:hypothetical protein
MDPANDIETTLQAVTAFKHERGGHVYRLIDLLDFELTFGDMVSSMGFERGREGGADDRDVTSVFLSNADLAKLGASSLRDQQQYGQADVHIYNNKEDALKFIREDIKKRG